MKYADYALLIFGVHQLIINVCTKNPIPFEMGTANIPDTQTTLLDRLLFAEYLRKTIQ